MTTQEKILGRIREALSTPAVQPDGHAIPSAPDSTAASPNLREWLPAVGSSMEEQFTLFAKNCADLRADFQRLGRRDDLPAALARLRDTENWRRIASHDGELSRFAAASLGLPVLFTDRGYDPQALEQCDAGITECDALIAQTGGVALTSRSAGGRALSVLPPHHVVLARREQLVADLPAALALLQRKYAPDFPSMISFITGPSRTGDIERILVLGAHGPKKLTILCV